MNKNKKITIAILMSLTALTMVGCGSKTTNSNDVVSEDMNIEGTLDSSIENTDAKGSYSVEQIKADFKIIEDFSLEVAAALANDTFVAGIVSTSNAKVSDDNLFMSKAVERAKNEAESIQIPQIKKLAEYYIKAFESQSNLTTRFAKGEIDEAGFNEGLSKILEDLASDMIQDLETSIELSEILSEHNLDMTDLLDSTKVQEKAIELAQEKYGENMKNIVEKALK